jgi:hypothetical protein
MENQAFRDLEGWCVAHGLLSPWTTSRFAYGTVGALHKNFIVLRKGYEDVVRWRTFICHIGIQ